MKGSDVFYYIDGLHHKCNKTSLNRGVLSIDSPVWLQNKKTAINLKDKDDNMCLKYAVTVALNERIEPSINQYNWKENDFPTGPKGGKSFETNNTTIALKVLFLPKQ